MELQIKAQILSKLTTRNDRGQHFTTTHSEADIQTLESEGLIEINRPVHEATGIPYGVEYWSVSLTDTGYDFVEANPAADYSEYLATIDASADACGEATQDQVNAMSRHLSSYLEDKFPGIQVRTDCRGQVTGPDEDTCEEINRAIQSAYEAHLANL